VELNEQQVRLLRAELAKVAKAVEMARHLKDMPRGRFPIAYGANPYATLIEDHQNTRGVVSLLLHDAWLQAHLTQYDMACESTLAMVNAGRAVEGDLNLIMGLIRISIHCVAVEALERVLAQGEPSEAALSKLQASLLHETQQNHWLTQIRGERAFMHAAMEGIRAGNVKASHFATTQRKGGVPTMRENLAEFFLSSIVRHYPAYLRYMNRSVEFAKLPIHERREEINRLADTMEKTNNPIHQFIGSHHRVHQAECRAQTYMRCATIAVACERYRIDRKTWPASLDVLVREKLLDAIPLDPFGGEPMRYRHTKDGVVIYSIGPDLVDNQGHIDRERTYDKGVDIGFRLWNVESRRQPPLPPVVEEER
jgi:hypothetical protein